MGNIWHWWNYRNEQSRIWLKFFKHSAAMAILTVHSEAVLSMAMGSCFRPSGTTFLLTLIQGSRRMQRPRPPRNRETVESSIVGDRTRLRIVLVSPEEKKFQHKIWLGLSPWAEFRQTTPGKNGYPACLSLQGLLMWQATVRCYAWYHRATWQLMKSEEELGRIYVAGFWSLLLSLSVHWWTLSPTGAQDWALYFWGCALNFSVRRSYAQSSIQAALSAVPQLGSLDTVLLRILFGGNWQFRKPEIHSWFDKNLIHWELGMWLV